MSSNIKADIAKEFSGFVGRFSPCAITNRLNIVTALSTEADRPAIIAKLHNTTKIRVIRINLPYLKYNIGLKIN